MKAVIRIVFEVVEVGGVARDEIIDADDAKALRQKTVGQVTAEKSGPSGDNCGFHTKRRDLAGWRGG
jgi:hypothetical protein